MGNFQGMYVHPGNSWDLRGCRQQPDEPLRDYIRRFSKQCTELPSVTDFEVISAFHLGTTCRDLVRELGRNPPSSANELFDIATNIASGEQAVGAIFDGEKGKRKGEAPAEDNKAKNNPKKPKQGNKGKKKGPPNQRGQGAQGGL